MKFSEELIKRACVQISSDEANGHGVCPDPSRFKGYVETAAQIFEAELSKEAANKFDDGGPAFPVLPPLDDAGQTAAGYPYPDQGMTLRDWFVGQALVGLLASGTYSNSGSGFEEFISEKAINIADALMAARKAGV